MSERGRGRAWAAGAVVCLPLLALQPVQASSPVDVSRGSLPLGRSSLPEVRTTQTLAPGVTLTRIVRGTGTATPSTYDTTSRGPWRVTVVSIDPQTAHGHLSTTYGADIRHAETPTALVRASGALAGVNASFFSVDTRYPGDPRGLAVHAGTVVSEPARSASSEFDVLVDSTTNRLTYGHLSWRGRLRNRHTGASLAIQHLNHPPARARTGQVSVFTRAFGAHTPVGRGVEVILDSSGCVVHRSRTRGRRLGATQRSVQATGRRARRLLRISAHGCLRESGALYRNGNRVRVGRSVYAASGHYQLVRRGRALIATGPGEFYGRNPRTIVGTTRTGQILIVAVDGRQASSVGTTMRETAAVAQALGLYNAVNLDGGSSTAMSVGGRLVSSPSSPTERPVGDALIFTTDPP